MTIEIEWLPRNSGRVGLVASVVGEGVMAWGRPWGKGHSLVCSQVVYGGDGVVQEEGQTAHVGQLHF